MVISFNQTRGHLGLQKTVCSFQQVTPNVSTKVELCKTNLEIDLHGLTRVG
jgi:hypothetical protein